MYFWSRFIVLKIVISTPSSFLNKTVPTKERILRLNEFCNVEEDACDY